MLFDSPQARVLNIQKGMYMLKPTKFRIYQPHKNSGNNNWYGVCESEDGRKKISLKTTQKKIAEQWLQKQNAQLYLPSNENPKHFRLNNLILEYQRYFGNKEYKSPRTHTAYSQYLTRFYNYKDKSEWLAEFDFEKAQRYLNHLGKTLSPKTLREHYKVLKKMFKYFKAKKYLSENPFENEEIDLPDVKVKEKPFWTLEEIDWILEKVPETAFPFFATLAHTGLRFSECIHLTFDCINFKEAKMVFIGKGGIEREVSINNFLLPILLKEFEKFGPGKCFPEMPETEFGCLKLLKRSLVGMDFQKKGSNNLHRFRHSFASNLLLKGASIKQVQKLMGHSSIRITLDTYTHILDKDLHATTKLLEPENER